MKLWEWAVLIQLFSILPCAYLCFFKRNTFDRLIGLEMASVIEALLLVALAQDQGHPEFYDIALTLSILTFGGGMTFIRFLKRWL